MCLQLYFCINVTIIILLSLSMMQEKHKNIGLGLRGQNIQMPAKINVKTIISKKRNSSDEDQQCYTPLNIEPKQLNMIPHHVQNHIRFRYSSRKNFDDSKKRENQRQKSQKKIRSYGHSIKKQEEELLKKRVETHLDYKIRRPNGFKAKKCICGDCEQCLKDFTYFLHIFSNDQSLPQISAKSWCIWLKGKNNKFLHHYGKRVHKTRQIASLTKMITSMTAIDFLNRYNYDPDKVTYAVRKTSTMIGGTSAKIQIGEVYTLTELLYGLMLPSGNDAAIAISQAIGLLHNIKLRNKQCDPHKQEWYVDFLGNSNKSFSYHFINLMNEKCQKLGLLDTKMFNSHGNDAYDQLKNVSTCNQVAKISSQYMGKYDFLKKIVKQKQYYVQRYNKKWQNTNKLLDDGFDGIKTGITDTAGPCLSACYKDIIIVVLNSKSMNERWIQVKKLVRWIKRKGF